MTKSFQFHFRQQTFVFKFQLGFSLLCLFFLILFGILGVWQIHRYHYKKNLLATYQQQAKSPIPFLQLIKSNSDLQFRLISAEGSYINTLTMLVQNQFYQGRIGFEVLTPFRISGINKLLLIDRGWIPKPSNQAIPTITRVSGKQHIIAYIKLLNEYQFILGKNILKPNMVPLIMQKIDINEISDITNVPFYPFVLRLDNSQANGFIRHWTISIIPPQRHLGYAVQWFSMAIVLLIAYLSFSCNKVRVKKDD